MSQIEKEFLAEECGVDESEVYNSFPNTPSFSTHELRGEFSDDMRESIGQMLIWVQCKPVNTILIRNVNNRGTSGLYNVYDVTDTLNIVAMYNSTVKRKVKGGLRERATVKFLEWLSAKEIG